ncbi:uncharacterized protein [Panulirus ornatus]|uniref:uncharacterized protein isoform X2 n=1 Tax=Panulirus ornatus TaxID=150431 RepID=UPI003A8B6B39
MALMSTLRFRKTVYRQILRLAQRVPRPLLLAAMCCTQVLSVLLASHRYRAALLSSLLLLCILLLSSPYVPERFLGIRSPDQVLKSFNTPQSNNNKETEGIMQPNKSKQHSVQKRYVPHKFWARAQPNNKFLKKRRHYKHQPNHPHQVKDIYPLEDWPRVAVEAVNTLH